MANEPPSPVTLVLARFGPDGGPTDELIQLVYSELRVLARAWIAREPPGHTLADQVVDEDAGLQSLLITGITSGPQPDEAAQVVSFGITTTNPFLIQAPTLSPGLVSGPYPRSVTLSYTPTANKHGSAVITVTADDGMSTNNLFSASFTITVNPVNEAPVANDDGYATDEDTPLPVVAPGVLDDDSDPDGDGLTASVVSGPANGVLTLNADGSFTYTPAAGFHGVDSFTYVANDGSLDSNIATVIIDVMAVDPVNQPPVASANGPYVGVAAQPLTLDASSSSDPEGAALTYKWDFGDGSVFVAGVSTASHTYAAAGTYAITLVVNDGLVDSVAFVTQATIGASGGGGRRDVDAFLSYVMPTDNRVNLPAGSTSYDVTIIYGSSILPETFQATLNGRPFAGFAPIPGTVQTVTIPLSPRRNTLVLQVDGVNARGRIARERDRLTFVVSRR